MTLPWGVNHGHRLVECLMFMGMKLIPDGTWHTVVLMGPASFGDCLSCYQVFRTATMMIDILTPAKIDECSGKISECNVRYGSSLGEPILPGRCAIPARTMGELWMQGPSSTQQAHGGRWRSQLPV